MPKSFTRVNFYCPLPLRQWVQAQVQKECDKTGERTTETTLWIRAMQRYQEQIERDERGRAGR